MNNRGGQAELGSSTVSAADNWDSGVPTPALRSKDATTAYGPRWPDGSLPAITFLTVAATAVGATTN
ncbi:hypothetical protein [Streptomyces sp. B21-083]|uniref:hypothetical protein n=1 Tax=Streptomyces sp. B21-083 TaxID=3039410 RepID=UPI002FF30D50